MAEDYFTEQRLTALIEEAKAAGSIPDRLAEALTTLGNNIDLFPLEKDPERYTVEFIYPH
jgi:hypothetical protein